VKTRDKQHATMQVNDFGTNVERWCGRAIYNIVRYNRAVAGPRPTVNSLLKPRRRRERFVRNGLLSRFPGGTCIRTFASARVCVCAHERASKQTAAAAAAASTARAFTLPICRRVLLWCYGASPRARRFVL